MIVDLNNAQNEFLQSLDGEMTPQFGAQLLELAYEGDTGEPEPGSKPDASHADDDNTDVDAVKKPVDQVAGKTDDIEHTAENTVILAKDGKHTIGFEKLVEARDGEKAAKAEAESAKAALDEANRKLEELQKAAQERADAGKAPTNADANAQIAQDAIDAGVDPAIFGDFSEAAMAKGIAELVRANVAAAVKDSVDKALEPLQKKEAMSAEEAHFGAIYSAHEDADSILESQEFDDWIKGQPGYAQQAINHVLDKGTSQEIIEVFSNYKEATGKTQAKPTTDIDPEKVKAAAKTAIANAKPSVPGTLSDFPGGRPGNGQTREEQMANMDGAGQVDAMMDMTPEQIETFLNRQL